MAKRGGETGARRWRNQKPASIALAPGGASRRRPSPYRRAGVAARRACFAAMRLIRARGTDARGEVNSCPAARPRRPSSPSHRRARALGRPHCSPDPSAPGPRSMGRDALRRTIRGATDGRQPAATLIHHPAFRCSLRRDPRRRQRCERITCRLSRGARARDAAPMSVDNRAASGTATRGAFRGDNAVLRSARVLDPAAVAWGDR